MATTYTEAMQRAESTAFRTQVRAALVSAAQNVIGEAGATTRVAKRHEHCVAVIHTIDRPEMVARYSYAAAMHPLISAIDLGDTIADATLQPVVDSLVDDFAGVRAGDDA